MKCLNTQDQLSVAFRLKTFFNHFIKNTQGDMGKVRDMQKQFRDYYENTLDSEIDVRKQIEVKKNISKRKKMV